MPTGVGRLLAIASIFFLAELLLPVSGMTAVARSLCEEVLRPGDDPDICALVATGRRDGAARALDAKNAVETIVAAAAKADFVLLGEVHDNPAHHRIRSQVLLGLVAQRLSSGRRLPGLVFEHIRADQDIAIAAFRAMDRVSARTVDHLFKALDWEQSGWPSAELFRPLFEAALDAELPILSGNARREDIRAVARDGIASLPADEQDRLGLSVALPAGATKELLAEIEGSHCGVLPQKAIGPIAEAQRYRDALMAHRLADAGKTFEGGILLAGNGHVRRDRGVPWHLGRMAPLKASLIVVFVEQDRDRLRPVDYIARGSDGKAIADFVVVTPGVQRPDPCTEMRRRYRQPISKPGAPPQ